MAMRGRGAHKQRPQKVVETWKFVKKNQLSKSYTYKYINSK